MKHQPHLKYSYAIRHACESDRHVRETSGAPLPGLIQSQFSNTSTTGFAKKHRCNNTNSDRFNFTMRQKAILSSEIHANVLPSHSNKHIITRTVSHFVSMGRLHFPFGPSTDSHRRMPTLIRPFYPASQRLLPSTAALPSQLRLRVCLRNRHGITGYTCQETVRDGPAHKK